VQAATLAIVAKVPVSLLRHAVAPHPTVNQVWDPLLAQESESQRETTGSRKDPVAREERHPRS
jgi:hypothetical protein